jgi:ubiquinol-cytochrome c reductase iron-sulfur subunit
VSGPAGRAIPQLPLAIDDAGRLYAQSGFTEAVGPSVWNAT